MVLTSTDHHRSTYGWQAAGTHPIGIRSCLYLHFAKYIR